MSAVVSTSAPAAEPRISGHVPALDAIRGIAILLVMVHHLGVMVPTNALERAFDSATHLGRVGVDLFFVLSGFLITGILLDTKGRPHYFRNFYVRRVLRIFPLYYAIVVFCLLVLPHFHHPKVANFSRIHGDEVWYWLFLQNYATAAVAQARHGILDVTWSLAIEEQFYLLWPAIVFWLSRRGLVRLCGALLLGGIVLRFALYRAGVNYFSIYVLTPCRLDGLVVGAWIAVTARSGGLLPLQRPAKLIGAAAILALGAIYSVEGLEIDKAGVFANVFAYTLWSLVFGAGLVLTLLAPTSSAFGRLMNSRFLIFFGLYSYGLYLIHLPLRAVIRDAVFRPGAFAKTGSVLLGQLIFYVLSTAFAVAVALALYHWYEKPFLNLKARFAPTAREKDIAPEATAVR